MASWYLMSLEVFFFLMIEEVLEIDIGDGYKTILMCLTLFN